VPFSNTIHATTTTVVDADSRRSEYNIIPDVVCYMHAIAACSEGGAHDWALVLLGDMEEDGVSPDVWVYNAAIHACAKARYVLKDYCLFCIM
jgi:pentatricopeptide repeat protein